MQSSSEESDYINNDDMTLMKIKVVLHGNDEITKTLPHVQPRQLSTFTETQHPQENDITNSDEFVGDFVEKDELRRLRILKQEIKDLIERNDDKYKDKAQEVVEIIEDIDKDTVECFQRESEENLKFVKAIRDDRINDLPSILSKNCD
jgi:ABC-type proline/glycine betaine transport system ATPase subunit